MQSISFKRHRFPPEFIHHAVWFHARFTLGYQDVEDLLAERSFKVDAEIAEETRPRTDSDHD